MLCQRYESKRRLILSHLKSLYDTEPMVNETSKELLRVVDTFEEHISGLRKLGEPDEQWSSSLENDLYIRLHSNTRMEWDRHCNAIDTKDYDVQSSEMGISNCQEMPKYSDMSSFLQGYATVLQSTGNYTSTTESCAFHGGRR